ncbi:C6 transcription factor [Pseudovirgaria hyperparasitica]|uniref:C6 transcription factor n=1 Tax=Pseudovirgaria hyperparasitica TaxID=470096 RepID=A0A6A6WIT6_9PEZI|nr:C6 transcription factor [Pseudovirgaria hyperparasitica]KAF2761141.1 C6 transcription factor [Pseudovirgaria hyperparasitica]
MSVSGPSSFSCLLCRQRKVKCNKQSPCSNCIKAEKPCNFIAPVRGTRKKIKPPKEGLHAKLQRYEELLKSYGAKIEASDEDHQTDAETVAQSEDFEMVEAPQHQSVTQASPSAHSRRSPERRPEAFEHGPKLVTKNGTSRYFDNAYWGNLGDELQHPEIGNLKEPVEDNNTDGTEIFFQPGPEYRIENLGALHPNAQVLSMLKDIFIDRVDPLHKIYHVPTFWNGLVKALQRPESFSKSLEAAAFAFYLATICSMSEMEIQRCFGAPKSIVGPRYRLATRQALVSAGFLSTSSPETLGAYAMFIMSVRENHRADTLYVMSGISIRLARKMGLHRDGLSLGLSPFETEMRRRLWWQLVYIDFRMADVLGIKPSLDLDGDTQKPLNVNDDDLYPDMTEFPTERNGITSITLCMIRCETMENLRSLSLSIPGDSRWEALSGPAVAVEMKDETINKLEDHLEKKYLRYCDPTNSLHTFASIMCRATICKLRLLAHNPRQFATSRLPIPKDERNIVFVNAKKLLEYVVFLQRDPNMERYLWQIGTSFLWNTMLYALIEARHRKTGPDVDQAWQLIGSAFSHYPQIFDESNAAAVYMVVGRWALQVWDEYVAASKAEGLPEPLCPDYINKIRQCHDPISDPDSPSRSRNDMTQSKQTSFSFPQNQGQTCNDGLHVTENLDSFGLPEHLSFEMDSGEWLQWDQFLAGQDGFVQDSFTQLPAAQWTSLRTLTTSDSSNQNS